jgi:hypothetical protein
MMRITTALALCGLCCLGLVVGTARRASAQIELDRIVARVNDRIITQSDVRQARLLRLVDDTSSDEAVRRSLENRLLILGEISRAAPLAPATDAETAARRAEWERLVGGGARLPALLDQAAMSEQSLQTWLRDDVRIQSHLKRQFGSVPDADRTKYQAEWIARLRQRAGLN